MKKPVKYTPEQALQYAAGICARSEQCEFDIRRKLSSHGISGSEADKIIDYLLDHDFLNEERYSCAYCRDKARFNRWGKIKIRAGLIARRVSREAVKKGLEAIDRPSYIDGLQRLTHQLAGTDDLSNHAMRMRLMRRLASRGFEPDLIADAIRREKELGDNGSEQ